MLDQVSVDETARIEGRRWPSAKRYPEAASQDLEPQPNQQTGELLSVKTRRLDTDTPHRRGGVYPLPACQAGVNPAPTIPPGPQS